jgi:hypothetical protein
MRIQITDIPNPDWDPVEFNLTKQECVEWIDELRSGKYAQGKGKLRPPEGYCCLGVKAQLEGCLIDGKYKGQNAILHKHPAGRMMWDGILPVEVRLEKDLPAALAQLNDKGATFAEIADVIEKLYLPLCK